MGVCAETPPRPITELPYVPGIDLTALDRSADPCVDFYQFSCGGWMKANPIPPDQASWDVYGKLAYDNQRFLWGILEALGPSARPSGAARSASQQKIGDYFAACMDEATVEKLGAAPLKPYLDLINGIVAKKDLPAALAHLQLATGDSGLFFGFGSGQDFEESSRVIAFASQGGLGLPDRDYYFKDDGKSKEIREKYVAHVERMFGLLGDAPATAKANAAKVMEIETELARASLSPVELRDPYKLFHKVDLKGLAALAPAFHWPTYLRTLGVDGLRTFNVTQPDFYRAFGRELATLSIPDIRTYLRWHLASATAPALSSAFVNANFDFYGKTLRGVERLKPRWRRCITLVDSQLGEALGEEFVRRAFSP